MKHVVIRGKYYERIPCGEHDFLENNKDGKPCKNCGAKHGEYHRNSCEAEMCPAKDECEICTEQHNCAGQMCGCNLVRYVNPLIEQLVEVTETPDLEDIRKKLKNIMGTTQVLAIAFENKSAFSFTNEQNVCSTFYSLYEQISQIVDELDQVIRAEITR